MFVIGKRSDELVEEDIQRLIKNKIPENRTLEYKQDLNIESKGDRKEFLFDVTSFYNSEGGVLIYGIKEKKDENSQNTGIPEIITGIGHDNDDKLTLQIEDLVKNGTEPSIVGLSFNFINVKEGKLLVIGIRKGIGLPCMVTLYQTNKFYKRRTSGKYLLDVYELNDMFMHNQLLKEQINEFITHRINDVRSSKVFPNIAKNKSYFLHIIPFNFNRETNLDLRNLKEIDLISRMAPLHCKSYDYMYNFDGFATYSQVDGENIDTYDQLFRNGIYEVYFASYVNENRNGVQTVPGVDLINDTEKKIKTGLSILKDFDIDPPFYISLSLINFNDVVIERGSRPIVQSELRLPLLQLTSYSEPILQSIKPIFDIIWQSVGFPESPIQQ